jgi:hypothetical protein
MRLSDFGLRSTIDNSVALAWWHRTSGRPWQDSKGQRLMKSRAADSRSRDRGRAPDATDGRVVMSRSYNSPRLPESGAHAPPLFDADASTAAPGTRDDVGRFLDGVYQAVARGDIDGATDEVFDRIDGLLENGEFAACDCIFQRIDLDRLDSNLMVAFLVITLPASEHLHERGPFYREVQRNLTRDRGPEAVEQILRGLE